MIKLDGVPEVRKTDVRLFVYDGQVLLTAARSHQEQTTNFRTPGGGFATVFVIESDADSRYRLPETPR
jgi:hypothetical protein